MAERKNQIKEEFRLGIIAVLINERGQALIGECANSPGIWQFPQGGIEKGESPTQAFFRELKEEIGNANTEILKISASTTRYKWPSPGKDYIGQEHWWILGKFLQGEKPNLKAADGSFLQLRWESISRCAEQTYEMKKNIFTEGLRLLELI